MNSAPLKKIAAPARKLGKAPVKIYQMFNSFAQLESSGGIILIICAVAALVWANAGYLLGNPTIEAGYQTLWHQSLALTFGEYTFGLTLHEWINDGLMAVFFLVVGLEIKRELLIGELSNPKQAILPILAAIGGMICPLLIYMALNPAGSPAHNGWGIPTVTDIAFSLGVLALLGSRVPFGLKVFLVALAIADDVGAVILIAVFYSKSIDWNQLLGVLGMFIAALAMNRAGVKQAMAYIIPGIIMWAFMLQSGIHATLAGILLAIAIPARSKIAPQRFYNQAQTILTDFRRASPIEAGVKEAGVREAGVKEAGVLLNGEEIEETHLPSSNEHLASVKSLEVLCEKAVSPLQAFERAIHPWTTFLVLPLFALANAGVSLSGISLFGHNATFFQDPVPLGIIAGLVLGKQLGVTGFSWLCVKLKIGYLPVGVGWKQLYAVSWLSGIGFTMSIFMANLAFTNPQTLASAKIAIFIASLLASVFGLLAVWLSIRHIRPHDETENTDTEEQASPTTLAV
ncbi:MAG: Na+/H+ antiporter NhaA [Vampirovibrionales bacterium]|nr:Na+/H+ antiporter NhaA [Vampirovibrionales bacterium]